MSLLLLFNIMIFFVAVVMGKFAMVIYMSILSPVPPLTIFSVPLLKWNAQGSIPCCQSKELKGDIETS